MRRALFWLVEAGLVVLTLHLLDGEWPLTLTAFSLGAWSVGGVVIAVQRARDRSSLQAIRRSVQRERFAAKG